MTIRILSLVWLELVAYCTPKEIVEAKYICVTLMECVHEYIIQVAQSPDLCIGSPMCRYCRLPPICVPGGMFVLVKDLIFRLRMQVEWIEKMEERTMLADALLTWGRRYFEQIYALYAEIFVVDWQVVKERLLRQLAYGTGEDARGDNEIVTAPFYHGNAVGGNRFQLLCGVSNRLNRANFLDIYYVLGVFAKQIV